MYHASTGGARRRGAVAILTLVMIFVLLGFAGLAVDGGYLFNLHNDVQIAADSGALAGVSALYEEDEVEAFRRARRFTGLNRAAQKPVHILPGNIVIGHWSTLEGTFTPLSGADLDYANAVRVVGSQHRVPSFFAGLIGVTEFNVDRSATAHRPPPCSGIWGTKGVVISGDAITDSYESESASYMPGAAGMDGDICSNGYIEVIGSAEVNGDASPGPGYFIDVKGAAFVTGSSTPGDDLMYFPPVDVTPFITNNDNHLIGKTDYGDSPFQKGGGLDVGIVGGSDNLTLTSGTYYFTSLEIKSQATITIDGDVTIYVAGDVRMGGGAVINASQDPDNLTIYSSGQNVELHGGTGFHGTVYAPEANVYLIGDSAYYGQVVGGIVDVGGNASIHVDQSLDLYARPKGAPTLVQ